MKHTLVLGIEHLMTGICLAHNNEADNNGFQFVRESPSMVRVEADGPFYAHWPNRSMLDSTPSDEPLKSYFAGDGEIEWLAQVQAPAMVREWERLFKAQTYCRVGSKLDEGEPTSFPLAVVQAMVRKHGMNAFHYLAQLRWSGDHWFYTKDRMFIGVEPDGHIHT